MSLIVAIKDENKITIAADTRVFVGNTTFTDGIIKYINAKNFIIGVAGTAYFIYAIKKFLSIEENQNLEINTIDDAQDFLNMVKKDLKDNHSAEGEAGDDGVKTYSVEIIIATNKGHIFRCGGYMDLVEVPDTFTAIGLPSHFTTGAMVAMSYDKPLTEGDIPKIFDISRKLNLFIGPNIVKTSIDIIKD